MVLAVGTFKAVDHQQLGDEASRVRRVSDFPLGRFSPSALFNQSSLACQSLLLATPVATLLGSYCLFPLGVDCICVASDFHTGCYLGTQHSARWARSASPADEVTSVENISDGAGVWLPVSGVRRPSRTHQWECSINSSSCLLNRQWERNEEPEGGDGGNATMWHASCLV